MKILEPTVITIAGGTFTLGVPSVPVEAEVLHRWCGPENVEVDSFAIAETPITVREYLAFLDSTQQSTPEHLQKPKFSQLDLPVTNISWEDANAYGQWLAEATRKPYRLPTDAEWECAARGGLTVKAFPWGDESPVGHACFGRQEDDGPLPVKSFPPNGWDLYDIVGNVWEWCSDLYGDVASDAPMNTPTGKDASINRVLRGGSYMTPDPLCLWCAYRHEDPPDLRHPCLGFRLAMNV